MQTIKAAIAREFGQPLVVEEVQLRAPLGGEVEVTLSACAICHSDISYIDGAWGGTLPAVYGHEAAGTITAVGAGTRGHQIGDRVIVTLIRSCTRCPACASARPFACEDASSLAASGPIQDKSGVPVEQGMYCGAFAEKVVVDASQVVSIGEDMAFDVASLLSCGVITGVGAVVNTAKLKPGQTALVVGAGGVGLNVVQGAFIAGASRIIALDRLPEKLEMAREFGATDGILADNANTRARIDEITDGRGVDAIFVSVGVKAAYDIAPSLLASGGQIIMVGMPPSGVIAGYEPGNMAAAGQRMVGSKMGDVVLSRDIPWMIELYRQGRLKLNELISKRWTLDTINEALDDTRSGSAKRNVIIF
jgi:S-(hydroxymethyl)glutathione dehydrogenase/alcohol dehydrogenase